MRTWNQYLDMAILAEMNESIWNLWKWGDKFQRNMRNIQRHNQIQMLKIEPDEPRNQMLRVFKLAEKEAIKNYEKSVLIDRRWLSDGSLECVYRAPDWQIRVDNIQENTSDYEYEGNREKSKARDEKIKKEKRAVEKTFNEFNVYFTGSRKQTQENKKLMELYS